MAKGISSNNSSKAMIDIEDEGTPLTDAVKKINFAGAGVTVTEPLTDELLVTIPGAGAGGLTDIAVIDFATSPGTDGGTYTTGGVWQTRPLGTIFANGTAVTIGSNQVTIPAGKWVILGDFSIYNTSATRIRLFNITDTVETDKGPAEHLVAGDGGIASIKTYIDIPSPKVYEFQQRGLAAQASNGMGASAGESEVYANIVIMKVD